MKVLWPQFMFAESEGTQQEWLRLFIPLLATIEIRQAEQRRCYFRAPAVLFIESEHTREERLGLLIFVA